MKKQLIVLLSLLLSISTFAQDDVLQLSGTMLGETPIEEDLQELCDRIGGRVTGSTSNEAAVEWALKKFRQAGVNTRMQPFQMPVLWLAGSTKAKITGTTEFIPNMVAKYQSPPGQYGGALIYVGNGDKDNFKSNASLIRNNFVLVQNDLCFDIGGLFAEYAAAANVETLADKYGAKGIIFMSSRPKKLLYRFITSKATNNTMPQFVMSREDSKRCIRILEDNGRLQIDVNIDAKVGGEFTSNNIIAEIAGSEKPEEIIIIGAHIDSWALGTGANDNGCNVTMLIDIARQMVRLGIVPKRTIRFALWNGEEQGYFGSWAYTKAYEKDMDKHIMALSIDIGSGAISGFFTNGREELVEAVDEILKPVGALGEFTQLNVPIVGTDNFDFMLQGVGNLVANHLSANYGQNYHAASDTYDKVDLKSLKRNSAIIAALTLGFANMDDSKITWKQQSRSEIQAMFEQHKLEFTMRMFNVWEIWISEARGRK